ncbi:MAG TPA: FYDLN acid domain-containing protein [Deltaproteobacteria bacterium]|nr:FYDLN acid domain-containing protein [Deltaproteobacteria bacterium]
MTKTDLIEVVARKKKLSKSDATDAVNAFLDAITSALTAGEKVILKDFMTFDPAEMADEPVAPTRPDQKIKDRDITRAGKVTSSRGVKGKAAVKEKGQEPARAAKTEKPKVPTQEKVRTPGAKAAPDASRGVKIRTAGQKTAAKASREAKVEDAGKEKAQKASKAAPVKAPATTKGPQAARAVKIEAAKEEPDVETARTENLHAVTREKAEKPSRAPESGAVHGDKEEAPRAKARKQPVKVEYAVVTLGTRFKCYKCGTKFYDLGKPQPICPSCEANQHSEEARETSKRKRRRRPHLMAKAEPTITAPEEEQDLIEVVDEVDAEYVLDVDDIVLEEGPDET